MATSAGGMTHEKMMFFQYSGPKAMLGPETYDVAYANSPPGSNREKRKVPFEACQSVYKALTAAI